MERRESGGWKEEYLSEVSIVLKRTVNQKVVGRMRGMISVVFCMIFRSKYDGTILLNKKYNFQQKKYTGIFYVCVQNAHSVL